MNHLWMNDHGRFTDQALPNGAAYNEAGAPEAGMGIAIADYDDDGDIDILVSNNNGHARLFRNELPHRGNWIELRVMDQLLRRDAIGARVRLTLSDGRVLTRFVRTDGSYLSASDPRVHFAWPDGVQVRSLEVVTPGGMAWPLKGVAPRAISTVFVGAAGAEVRR